MAAHNRDPEYRRPKAGWLITTSSTSARIRSLRARLEVEGDLEVTEMIRAQPWTLAPRNRADGPESRSKARGAPKGSLRTDGWRTSSNRA
jgi:hypothetical protein